MCIELVTLPNHLILCSPLLQLSIFPSIGVFSNESVLRIRWPKYWRFSFSISPSIEYSGLISFRMDWLALLAVQGTLKSLLQHHSSKASILRRSTFFIVQLSHPYMTTGKTIALTRRTLVGKVMSLLFNTLFSEKVGLKLNIQKTKIMASCPITSWQIDGETMETMTNFIFLGSTITADGDCSHEIKRHLLLGRKVMTNLDSIFKSRDVTLPTKVHLVKASFSSSHVWMWELDYKERWSPKNWCFWTVVLERTLKESLRLQGEPTSPS